MYGMNLIEYRDNFFLREYHFSVSDFGSFLELLYQLRLD